MELKYGYASRYAELKSGSNCTFMELKFIKSRLRCEVTKF